MFWDEMEQELGGRVKSVLLVALCTVIMVLAAKGSAQARMQQDSNPIDAYFAEISEKLRGEKTEMLQQDRVYQLIYLECWEQELAYAYQCLERSNPHTIEGASEEVQQCFRDFAYLQGSLEAGGYTSQDTRDVAGIQLERQSELVKALTLRIYELLGQETFSFQREAAEEMLKNSGWLS